MPFKSDKQRRFLWSQKPEVAKQIAYKQEGGQMPEHRKPKKVTEKDRYGNQITYEYESDVKPLDINALYEAMMDRPIPEMMIPEGVPGVGGISVGFADHPGEPRGSDTVPAWLTPGEFVLNKEGKREMDRTLPGLLEAFNNLGREQQAQGMQDGGPVPVPVSPTQALLEAREGFRSDVYLDSLKKPTVGHGHLLPEEYKGRVGETPFTREQLDQFFVEDQAEALAGAKRNAKKYGVDWDKLNRREQAALTSMAFQLGETGQGEFENMWTALAAGDKELAALEALDSNWGAQTPERAKDVYNALTPGLGFQQGGPVGSGLRSMAELQQARQLGALTQREYLEALKYVSPTPGYKAEGGPVYAYRGYDVAQQDVREIEDPTADLSSSWVPPIYGADEISPMEQAILDDESQYEQRLAQQIAMADNMVAGGDGDDLGREVPPVAEEVPWWEGITDWAFGEEGTRVADERNAAFNVKAAEANLEAAGDELAAMKEAAKASDSIPGIGPSADAIAAKEAEVQHQAETLANATDEATALGTFYEDIDAAGVVAEETRREQERVAAEQAAAAQAVMEENDTPEEQKSSLEELANSEEFNQEDDPSKPSEKGTQSESEVTAAGEEAAKENPALKDKALGFFKGAFNDLFDGKELARMAIMYVGSRALGYSHGGSLNWAAKQYVERLDAKHASVAQNAKEFAKSGKYTPASVAAYQKSGDLADLQTAGASFTVTGNTNIRSFGGQKVAFQEVKDSNGNVMYRSPDGKTFTAAQLENASKPYEAAFEKGTPEYRARRSRATGDAAGRFEEVWKAEDRFFVGKGDSRTAQHNTNIRPKQAADEFWGWAEREGLDPESDEALAIMTNAYQSAIADGKAGGVKPSSLIPYLQQEKIREDTGAPELFITNPDREPGARATYIRGDKMAQLNRNVEAIAGRLPGLAGLNAADASSRVYDAAVSDWNRLTPELQEKYNKSAVDGESGFYKFMNKRLVDMFNQTGG